MPSGYIYSWTGHSSTGFGTASNWYNSTTGTTATAVPGTSDEALIGTSGTVTGAGNVFELGLTGPSSGLTIGGSLNGSYVFVGGTVTLASGAALSSGNEIDIGDDSASNIASHIPTTLNVGAGSSLSTSLTTPNSLDILVGQNGGSGTLSVTGAGAVANSGIAGFWVGNAGTGLISVGGGGQVSAGTGASPTVTQIGLALGSAGGSGTFSLYGAGSAATFGDAVEVGFGGTGLLAMSTGATLNVGDGANSLAVGSTYDGSNGSGTVIINGATANLNGVIDDGAFGNGYIDIGNGSAVTAYATTTTGAAATWSALLGETSGSSGILAITSGGQMTTARGIAVGSAGYGELDVWNGALYIDQPQGTGLSAIDVGVDAGASGLVNVSDGLINDINDSGIIVGGGGSGTLNVNTGGQVLTGGPGGGGTGLSIGVASGSSGNVWVDDPGSTLNVSGAIIDGYGGTGVISVWNGGQIDAGGEQAATGLALGGPSGSGILAITADGRVTIGGQADIGQFGAGLLEVTTGGTFSATASGNAALIAGVSSGATGSVLVSDPGSVMSLTGGLVVGSLGSGTFTAQNLSFVQVSNAASATALGVTVGAYAGGSGTLSLASQALLETSAGVAVGSVGAGVLNDTDALLYITAAPATGFSALGIGLSAGSSGTVNVAGGQIIDAGLAGTVIGSAGTGTLNITQGGVVQTGIATGNALVLGLSSGASGAVSISGSGSTLDVSGPVIDGNNGTGTITLAEGANFAAGSSASADALELGSTGGAGALSVSSLAEATVLGQLTVGEFGTGTVSISGGGQVSVDSSGIYSLIDGNAAGADGSVLITGAGSTLTLNDGAQIGITGAGSVSLQDGGVLDNTNTGVGVQVGEAGTVSLLGGTLLAGSTLTIEAGGTLTGQGSVSASAVIDSGSINATGGTLAFIGAISGSGSLSISGNADLSLSTTQGDGYTLANNLNFGAGGGTLTLGDVFGGEVTGGGTISGWASGDYVVLPNPTLENGYTPASESFANGTLTLFGSSGQVVDTLNFAGALTTNNFTLTQVGNDTVIGFHS